MAYALHSSDIFHQISGHGALNEGNASLCGSFCQSNIRLILEQAIESGWSNHQRHFSHASNDGPLEAAVRLINQSMRHEPPFSERLSFPIKRDRKRVVSGKRGSVVSISGGAVLI